MASRLAEFAVFIHESTEIGVRAGWQHMMHDHGSDKPRWFGTEPVYRWTTSIEEQVFGLLQVVCGRHRPRSSARKKQSGSAQLERQ